MGSLSLTLHKYQLKMDQYKSWNFETAIEVVANTLEYRHVQQLPK
jgi:hypothetical protein